LRQRTDFGAVAVTLLLVVGFSATTNGAWPATANLPEVLRNTSVLAIMAFGEALVITTGEIDISVGSIFGIVGISYMALGPQLGTLPAILIALGLALAIGALNGFVVAYFRISSLVVTLGSLFIFRGLILALTQSPPQYSAGSVMQASAVYQMFGSSDVLGFNDALIWAIVLMGIVHYVLFWTPAGNRLLAVGGNAPSAQSRGVSIAYTKWAAYVACAFFAGLASILEASNLGLVDGSFGHQRELFTIAAAVLGGCALVGGRSSIIGTFFGAFILQIIKSFLINRAVNPEWFVLLSGFIIVVVSLADRSLTQLLVNLGGGHD